jgi:hypothetical protein
MKKFKSNTKKIKIKNRNKQACIIPTTSPNNNGNKTKQFPRNKTIIKATITLPEAK